jgi:hypothetical protein
MEEEEEDELEELYKHGNPGEDDMIKDDMKAMYELVGKQIDEVEENVKL